MPGVIPDGAVIVKVELPGIVTVLVLRLVVRAEAPFNTRLTLPEKPRIGETLTVDVHGAPLATTAMKEGSVKMSKSGCLTCTSMVMEVLSVPLVPVISTKYVPAFVVEGALTVRTELPVGGRVTEDGVSDGLTSVDGE